MQPARDIQTPLRAERGNADRDRRLAETQALADVGSYEWDLTERRQIISDQLCRIYGHELGFSPTFEEFVELVHPDDRAAVLSDMEASRSGIVTDTEYRIVRPDGEVRHVHGRRYGRVGPQGLVTHLVGTVQDITGRVRVEFELQRERDHLATILAAMAEGYLLIVGGRVVAVNDALCQLTAFAREDLIGADATRPFWSPGDPIESSRVALLAQTEGTHEAQMVRKDGVTFTAELTVRPAHEPDGSVLGWVCTVRDVSERRRYELELKRLATHDGLTGLANHRTFHERLEDEVATASRHHRGLYLAVIDLDDFKAVNDAHGHQAGDHVLAQVAHRLADQVRRGELLARVGGEEFAWLLSESDARGALAAAGRARHAIGAVPFEGVGTVTISIGVAGLGVAEDAADVYRHADAALYRAKELGRNRVELDGGGTVGASTVPEDALPGALP